MSSSLSLQVLLCLYVQLTTPKQGLQALKCVCISGHTGIHEHVRGSQISHVHMIRSDLFLEMSFHAVFHLYINMLRKFKHYKRSSNILQTAKG